MFTRENTEGYTADELAQANAALEQWDATHPDADVQDRKAAQEEILRDIDNRRDDALDTGDLTAEVMHGVWTVVDSAGGRWWPSKQAHAEIEAADHPAEAAIAMAVSAPTRGDWHS